MGQSGQSHSHEAFEEVKGQETSGFAPRQEGMIATRQRLQEIALNTPPAPFPESDDFQKMVLDFATPVRQAYEAQLEDGDPIVSAMNKLDDLLRQRGILWYGDEWLTRFVNEVAEECGFEVPWEVYELPTNQV